MKFIDVRTNPKSMYDPHPAGLCSCSMCANGHSPSGRLLAMNTDSGKVLCVIPDDLRNTVNVIIDGYRMVPFSKEADDFRNTMNIVNADYSKIEERVLAHYMAADTRFLNPLTMKSTLDDLYGKPNQGNRRQRRKTASLRR